MFLLDPFKTLYKNRRMLFALSKDEINKKYAGSMFGIVWMFLYPVLFLLIYSFVYAIVLKVKLGIMTTPEYIALIFSGLLPFLAFSEMMGVAVTSIIANSQLIKNTLVPIDLMPPKSVIITQPLQLVGTTILIIALAIMGNLTPYAFIAIYVWICEILFYIGLAWLLASLGVFFRDLQTIIPLISVFLMFASPIAYTIDMIPHNLQFLMNINPLYYFITAFQDSLVIGVFPRSGVLLPMSIIAFTVFYFGYWFFTKTKNLLADNI